MFSNLEIKSLRPLKGGHFRLELKDDSSSARNQALWFSPPSTHSALNQLDIGNRVDLLAEPQWNYFNGKKTLQLLVKDIRISK